VSVLVSCNKMVQSAL